MDNAGRNRAVNRANNEDNGGRDRAVSRGNNEDNANKVADRVILVRAGTRQYSIRKCNSSSPKDRSPMLEGMSISPMFEQVASISEASTAN